MVSPRLLGAVLLIIISALLETSQGANHVVPPDFKLGVASSSYQIEGGWNASDKSPHLWDFLTHTRPEIFAERSSGDVACDSYHLWRRDVEMVKDLGADFYRFSISWARLFPNGFANKTSLEGYRYYSDLIDGLLENGVEPIVTLYHWETPMALQDLGGWTNPLMSDWFADYAREAFQLFGDRVKTWLTVNEAVIICDLGYGTGLDPSGGMDHKAAMYLCNKHMVLAHAKAYRIYDAEFRMSQKGRVSLASQMMWFDPLKEDYGNLTELVRLNMARSFHPIFSKEGTWHKELNEALSFKLPPFTPAEIELIRGSYDFLALNFYTSRLIRPSSLGEHQLSWPFSGCPELEAFYEYDPAWKRTDATVWFYLYPEGLRKLLSWIKTTYGDVEILITENGYPTLNDTLHDANRTDFYREHLEQVLLAKQDGVNVVGYTAWTLMDNFEWRDGYRTKFGLYQVDFSKPDRPRTMRDSARYFQNVIASRTLQVPEV